MSINVTVHGNPVSIRRGKMVAIDANKEFERRRKIRLQQVRQQSKEIAEEVRNKVRREKNKQYSNLEKKSENDLKRLQEKKLATLKKQYEDCLQEFGCAYKNADIPDPHEIIALESELCKEQAEFRGILATEKQKEEKKQLEKEQNKTIEDKKHARSIENLRSKLVSTLQKTKCKQSNSFKTKRKKKCVADIRINGITQIMSDDSEEDSNDSDLVNLSVLEELTPNTQTSKSTNNNISSVENSVYSERNSNVNDSVKENDIDAIIAKKSGDTYNTDSRTKISFKDSEFIEPLKDLYDNEYQDKRSYRSHRSYCDRNKCSCSDHELERDDSQRKIYDSSSYHTETLAGCASRGDGSEATKTNIKTIKSDLMKQRSKYDQTVEPAYSFNNTMDQYKFPKTDSIEHEILKKYNERLQSGKDDDDLAYTIRKVGICDENSCPEMLSEPKRATKIKGIKSSHSSRLKSSRNVYRKTIRSDKTPFDKVESEELINVHDYDVSEEDLQRPSYSKSNTLQRKGTGSPKSLTASNKRISPKKSRSKSPPTSKACIRSKNDGLPFIPTVAVRPESTETIDSTIKYYDRFNRFGKEYSQSTVVQKISKESLEVCPPSDEERQYLEIMKQRDADARRRGNKALEKNRIHRDYQQLMEELPVLQRQERLTSMISHNPVLHMNDERYRELERKKQNEIENVYENFETKSKSFDIPLITLKSVRKSPPSSEMKNPFKTLDVSENSPSVLNVGQWENVNSTTSSSSQETPEEASTDLSVDKEQALANLLKRVNTQRKILLQEAANLPSLTSLRKVLNEEELISLLCKCTKPQDKVLVETGTSPLLTKDTSKKIKKGKSVSSNISSKRTAQTSSSDTSVGSCRKNKKGKVHKKIKVLIKEEGTQTSPCIEKNRKQVCVNIKDKKEGWTQTSDDCPNMGGLFCQCLNQKHNQVTPDVPDHIVKYPKNNSSTPTSPDNVCEIIIKATDSNVQISQRSSREKSTPRSRHSGESHKKKSPKKQGVFIKIKEELPRNAMEMSTSTSYMSPPANVSKSSETNNPCSSWQQVSQRPSNKDLLQPQRQQTNIDNLVRVENGAKEVNPRLVKYITRLLNMSRQSIDELTISSVSDVSTPTDSIIHTTSNVAKEKLQSVMDHFNLSLNDIKKYYLSTSTLSTSDLSVDNVHIKQKTEEQCQTIVDPGREESYKKLTHVRTISPTRFTSVSTSTDPEQPRASCSKSPKSSGTSRENESVSNGCQRNQTRSPKTLSPTPRVEKTKYDGQDPAYSSAELEQIMNVRSFSPKPTISSKTFEKENHFHKIKEGSPQRVTTITVSEEYEKQYPKLDSPSTSTEQKQCEPCNTSSKKTKSPKKKSSSKSTSPKSVSPKSTSPKKVSISPEPTYSPSCSPKSGIVSIQKEYATDEAAWRDPEKFLQFVRQSLGMTVEEFSELGFHEMFSKHMELTEYCQDRIKSLMTLIEKVRTEKTQICSPSPVDNSMTLTSYLELPQSKSNSSPVKRDCNNGLKKSSIEPENSSGSACSSVSSVSQKTLDEYLLGLEKNGTPVKIEKIRKQVTYEDEVQNVNEAISFVPILQGIPKYSEVDSARHSNADNLMLFQQIKPRPPPSLLRSNMRGQTDAIPHELSTIAEAETLVSSRNTSMHPPQTPEERRIRDLSPCRQSMIQARVDLFPGDEYDSRNLQASNSEVKITSPVRVEKSLITSDSGDYITISPEVTLHAGKELRKSVKTSKVVSPILLTSSSSTHDEFGEIRIKSSLSGVRPLSDSTTESPDELESMLRKFKLEWAIALVRKTEQALALSSSSSASDIVQSRTPRHELNPELSARETYKQLYKKIASSTGSDIEKSQIFMDLSQHFREFHDISEIPGVAESRNKSQQRTSTPVQHSKSTESKKSVSKESLFKGDSELSSVRYSSDENMFLSIPNITLNTTKCSLNKSKK